MDGIQLLQGAPLRGGSLLFATKFPDIPGTQIVNFNTLLGKNKVWVPEKFQCFNTTLVAFFKIRFGCLLFEVEKRRQYSEVTAIPWDLL